MLATLVLIGRPNVGKSTLFNRLTKTRNALVADFPGLTRDRHYGRGIIGSKPYLVVDTGGFEPVADSGILLEMARQTLLAVEEADVVIFMVDGRQGLTPQDKTIAQRLRKLKVPVLVVVNKTEGIPANIASSEFFELGLGEPLPISSAHGEGIHDLVQIALSSIPQGNDPADPPTQYPKVAIAGRPNVGKSTLVNTLLGENRVIAFDQPGTTRDAIYLDFQHHGQHYTLIDTAGIRKRGKIFETVEKFSVIKTMQAIEDAHVVVLMIDAQSGVTEQEAHIAAFILETGRALVVAVNKWDGLDTDQRAQTKQEVHRKLQFLDFARFHYISAQRKTGLLPLLQSVDEAYQAAMINLPTHPLTQVLELAIAQHQPPIYKGIRPKLRYAHQGGNNPPVIVIHGNHLQDVKSSYVRYLEGVFRNRFSLMGTPLRIQFKQGKNPYVAAEVTTKKKVGTVTMRRQKTALRAKLKAKTTRSRT